MAVYVHIKVMAFIYCSNILRCFFNCTNSLVSSEVAIYPDHSVGNNLEKNQRTWYCSELILDHLTMLFQLEHLVV
jgi:hypothetical protein